ncbi:MAG: hypothetical protein IJW48_02890 [Clostridia bacterium]|nr:hypothetical protein [Clostridia bacterium]
MDKLLINNIDGFIDAVLKLDSKEACKNFFLDVCTIKELQDMSQRLLVAKELRAGRSYQEISRSTGASTATISRVNRCLNWGSGGYAFVLDSEEKDD